MTQVITNLADSIAHLFIKNGWGSDEEREIYRYGCEVIISALINIFLVAACGCLFHMVGSAFLFYIVFLILRRYCGGFHADTYLVCNSVFTGIVLVALLGISQCERIPAICLAIAMLISFLVIVRYSPISHKNKPLTQSEKTLYRKVAITISGVFGAIAVIFFTVNKEIAAIITLAMLATACTMIASVIIERREKYER